MKYILWIWSTAAVSDPTSFAWQQLGGALETRPACEAKALDQDLSDYMCLPLGVPPGGRQPEHHASEAERQFHEKHTLWAWTNKADHPAPTWYPVETFDNWTTCAGIQLAFQAATHVSNQMCLWSGTDPFAEHVPPPVLQGQR